MEFKVQQKILWIFKIYKGNPFKNRSAAEPFCSRTVVLPNHYTRLETRQSWFIILRLKKSAVMVLENMCERTSPQWRWNGHVKAKYNQCLHVCMGAKNMHSLIGQEVPVMRWPLFTSCCLDFRSPTDFLESSESQLVDSLKIWWIQVLNAI